MEPVETSLRPRPAVGSGVDTNWDNPTRQDVGLPRATNNTESLCTTDAVLCGGGGFHVLSLMMPRRWDPV